MLATDRLRLRALERSDLPLVVTWLNDPEVRRGMVRQVPMSLAQEEDFYAKVLQRPAEEQPLVLEIRQADAWRPIGIAGFRTVDWRNRGAELGISIGTKEHWGQGLGTETVRVLLAYAFDTLNLHRVSLQVYESNRKAVRCYEKAGFTCEGKQREAVFLEGRYEGVLVFGVLRHEWEQSAGRIRSETTDEP